jgi:hypothetical protein
MDPKTEVIKKLGELYGESDNEVAHSVADAALLTYLEQIGHKDVADAWRAAEERVGFWYA